MLFFKPNLIPLFLSRLLLILLNQKIQDLLNVGEFLTVLLFYGIQALA
jgi:hypothetical protein